MSGRTASGVANFIWVAAFALLARPGTASANPGLRLQGQSSEGATQVIEIEDRDDMQQDREQ
jgi:hypothetical protein